MPKRNCSVDNCERVSVARGLCSGHYQRQRSGRDLSVPLRERVGHTPGLRCSVDGCDREVVVAARMLCHGHYKRWQRTGAVGGELRPTYAGDKMDYRRAHEALTSARGRASDYDCAMCGVGADEWAYDHADPCELLMPQDARQHAGFAYSLNFEHYQPMCRSCHRITDLNRGKHAAKV